MANRQTNHGDFGLRRSTSRNLAQTSRSGVFSDSFAASLNALAAMHELSSQRQSLQAVMHSFGVTKPKQTAFTVTREDFDRAKVWKRKDPEEEPEVKQAPIKIFGRKKVTIEPLALPSGDSSPQQRTSKNTLTPSLRPMAPFSLPYQLDDGDKGELSLALSRRLSQKAIIPRIESRRDSKTRSSFVISSSSSRSLLNRPSSQHQQIKEAKENLEEIPNPLQKQISVTSANRNLLTEDQKPIVNPIEDQKFSLVFKDFKVKNLNDFVNYPLEKYDFDFEEHFNYEYFIQNHRDARSMWMDEGWLQGQKEPWWRPCWINDYDPQTREFTIRWKHNLQTKKVRRMNLYFKGEDKEKIKRKREEAIVSRCLHLLSLSLKEAALHLDTVPACRVIMSAEMLQRIVVG
jgi:hypothetical protein